MSTTLTDYRLAVRHATARKSIRRHDVPDIDRAINASVGRVFRLLKGKCAKSVVYINTTAGDREYDLDTHFPGLISINSVYWDYLEDETYTRKVHMVSDRVLDKLIEDNPAEENTPEYCSRYGMTLRLFPLVNVTGSNMLRIKGKAHPTKMSDTDDTSGLEDACDEAVILAATMQILRADRRGADAADVREEFWVEMRNLKKVYAIGDEDGEATCSMVMEDDGSGA